MKRLVALVFAAGVTFIPAANVSAWRLDSACVHNVWQVSNPENEQASTGAGPIAAHGTLNIPEGTDKVTATWPSDMTPRSYVRPAGCHKEVPTSTSSSTTTIPSTTSTTQHPIPSSSTNVSTTSSTVPSSTSTSPSTSSVPPASSSTIVEATTTSSTSTVPPTPTSSLPSPSSSSVTHPSQSPTIVLPETGSNGGWKLTLLFGCFITLLGAAAVWATRR